MRSAAVALLAVVALLTTLAAAAQPAPRLHRIGLLMPSTPAATANLVAAFEQGLREHGYVQGRNAILEYRYSSGRAEQVEQFAAELAHSAVDVIVTTTDSVAASVKRRAGRIPIVMVNSSDPVGRGLVESLAHPGGNVTGLTNFSPEISAKRMQLLKEAVPRVSRIAYLWNPDLTGAAQVYAEIRAAARTLDLQVQSAEARGPEDVTRVLTALKGASGTALLVQAPNPVLYTMRKEISRLTAERRMPSIFNRREYVSAGGLMSYGPNVPEMYRRAAGYVDAILKGASPADLPIEQPSKFELAINLSTARALGVVIPQSMLLRANEVIDK